MKKILMNFSENVLSRSQMKAVRGGSDTPGEGGGAGCPAGACLGTKSDCGAGCTACSSSDPKVYGTCS